MTEYPILFRRATHSETTGEYQLTDEESKELSRVNFGMIHLLESGRWMTIEEIIQVANEYNEHWKYPGYDPGYDILNDILCMINKLIILKGIEIKVVMK